MVAIADKHAKCGQIEHLIAQGKGVTKACREVGVSEQTLYRWRKGCAVSDDPERQEA